MNNCKNCNIEINPENVYCHKCFLEVKNLRMIEPNEIVFDVDNREIGFEAINFIGINLYNIGYNFEIYYAKGQKSPHLHVKEILFLDLKSEQLKKYKEEFVKKFTPEKYLEFTDLSVCSKHAIAEENKPHFKYKTVKKLCGIFNEDNENLIDYDLYDFVVDESKQTYKPITKGSGITAKIVQQISIIDIAKQFGLEVNSKAFAVCPFHNDSEPSLKFYENQGRFICFGCHVKGNIIYFYALIKKVMDSK